MMTEEQRRNASTVYWRKREYTETQAELPSGQRVIRMGAMVATHADPDHARMMRKAEATSRTQSPKPKWAKAGNFYAEQRRLEELARLEYDPAIESLGVVGVAEDAEYFRAKVGPVEENFLVPGAPAGSHALTSYEYTEDGPQMKRQRWGVTYYSVPPIEMPGFDDTVAEAMSELEWNAWAEQARPYVRGFLGLWGDLGYEFGSQQAFLADEWCRMIERQRDSCIAQGQKLAAEIEALLRRWNDTEIEIRNKEQLEARKRMFANRCKSLAVMLRFMLGERQYFADLCDQKLDAYMPLKEKAANTRLRMLERAKAAKLIGMSAKDFERERKELSEYHPRPDLYEKEVPAIRTGYADALQHRIVQDYWGSQSEVEEHNAQVKLNLKRRAARAEAKAKARAAAKNGS